MITINDIAKAAGVSHGTVSNVLNKKGNVSSKRIKMVEDAIAQLGYNMNEKAKLLRKGVSSDLALIVPNLDSRCYTDFYSSFLHQAEKSGYHVRLCIAENSSHRERELAAQIRSELVRGIAVFSSLESSSEENPYRAAGFSESEILYVERRPFENTNYIGFDYAQCAVQMANTVLRKKFRNITLFTENADFYDQKLFIDTFTKIVRENSNCQIHHVQSSVAHGYGAAMTLFDGKEQPEAVFASNIVLAQQVKSMLYNFFDVKKTLVYTVSPLYTIPENQLYKFEMNYRLLGKHAAERLISQLDAMESCEESGEESGVSKSAVLDPAVSEPTVLPIEGTRIWAHYAENCPKKKITLLARNILTTEVIQNLANLYTKSTNVEIAVSTFSYDDLYNILNQNSSCHFDLLCLDVLWMSSLAESHLEDLNALDPDISSTMENQFLPGSVEIYSRLNGRLYGIPFSAAPQILFYRKDLFESAINRRLYFETYKQELNPPKTYREYNQIAEFFTRRCTPASPVSHGTTLNLENTSETATEFLMRYFSHTDSLFDSHGQLLLDSPAGMQALEEYLEARSFCKKGGVTSWHDAARDFLHGDTAMTILYGYYMSEVADSGLLSTDKIGFAPVPGGNHLFGGTTLGISKDSVHKQEALDFIRYLCREEISTAIAFFGGMTAVKKVYENYEVIDKYPWLSLFPDIYAAKPPVRRPADAALPFNEQQLLNIIGFSVRNVLTGTMDRQEALRYACQTYRQIYFTSPTAPSGLSPKR